MSIIKYKWVFDNRYNIKVLKNVEIKVNNEKINIKNNKKLNIKNNIEKIIWVNSFPRNELLKDTNNLNCDISTKVSNDGFNINLHNDVSDFRIVTKNLYQFDESENIYNINLCLNFTKLDKSLAPTFYLVYPQKFIKNDDSINNYFVYCDNVDNFNPDDSNKRCDELDLFEFNLDINNGDVLMQITLHSDMSPCNQDVDYNSGCRYYVVFTDDKYKYKSCVFDISGWVRNKNNNCNTVFLKKGKLFDGDFGLNIEFNKSDESIKFNFIKENNIWDNCPIVFKDGGNNNNNSFNIDKSIKNIFINKFSINVGINSNKPPFNPDNIPARMCCYNYEYGNKLINKIENNDNDLFWSIKNLKLKNIKKLDNYIHYDKVKYNDGYWDKINICNLNM